LASAGSSRSAGATIALGLLLAACGGSPVPRPTPIPPPPETPPANALPVIDAITIQGTRSKEPANFADAGESVAVSAKVHDEETAADQLQYTWTADVGTFSGSGATVTWVAPSSVAAPVEVTISLKATEKYGSSLQFQHSVDGSATLSLHDSIREVGDMARQFLLDFSDSSVPVDVVMRNFSSPRCPDPSDVDSEHDDVARNRRERRITAFSVGAATTTVGFGGRCPYGLARGDACASVPVLWSDIELSNGRPSTTSGNDIVAAAYAPSDRRWWLCASSYQALGSVGTPFRFSGR
jgi:hypothetical protein